MKQEEKDYQRGLLYCLQQDVKHALFYLQRAANAGHKEAKEALEELKAIEEKKQLPPM